MLDVALLTVRTAVGPLPLLSPKSEEDEEKEKKEEKEEKKELKEIAAKKPEPERPRSSSMTTVSLKPSSLARSTSAYWRR